MSERAVATTIMDMIPRGPYFDVDDYDDDDDVGGDGVRDVKCASPRTVSVVGLGCSSFSTFFWTEEDRRAMGGGGKLKEGDGGMSLVDVGSTSSTSSTSPSSRDGKFHPKVKEWIDTIEYAVLDAGITLLDTAPWYGHGSSEVVVGYAMERILLPPHNDDDDEQEEEDDEHRRSENENDDETGSRGTTGRRRRRRRKIRREEIIINTKVGRYESDPAGQFDFSYETTLKSAERSLRRMRCRYVDVLQLHDPEFAPSMDQLFQETIPAMMRLRDEMGLCRELGMTGYPLSVQYQIFQRTAEVFPRRRVWDQALTYGHFNLHDDSLVTQPILNASVSSSAAEEGEDRAVVTASSESPSFASYCVRNGVRLLAAAPLSMGLLTSGDDAGPPDWHPAGDELKRACRRAAEICRRRDDGDVDLSRLALFVALVMADLPVDLGNSDARAKGDDKPIVRCTILGMKDVRQVRAVREIAQRIARSKKETAAAATETTKTTTTSSSTPPEDPREEDDDDAERYAAPSSNGRVLRGGLRRALRERLRTILSKGEYDAWEELSDPVAGPFAGVWSDGSYRWDGIEQARTFWNDVERGRDRGDDTATPKAEEWQLRG